MRLPYIRVRQKGEVFFITKITIPFLKKHVTFHYRDPYKEQDDRVGFKYNDYLERLYRKGIELRSSDEGIQRRLQLDRINSIKQFVEASDTNLFPNSVLLSANVSKQENFLEKYLIYEEQEVGYFDLDDDIEFMIIDGQHRLAGLFIASDEIAEEIEMPAILLFNISLSMAARLFSDINGKQKPVNKSLIYDLLSDIEASNFEEMKGYHTICQKFYTDKESPLYRQIKMLGLGNGAISQAFFVDYVMAAIRKTDLRSIQDIYEQLFYYFKAFQQVFPDDWPVPDKFQDNQEVEEYAIRVLKKKRSQLVKTNGFGAILTLFPEIYSISQGKYSNYIDIINRFKGMSWISDGNNTQGTGKAFQKSLVDKMRDRLKYL